ncbi:hypothetical protein BDZ94DRAFT_636131 [Collybia nuda]|uniref:Uncharacterized protein n=1 Tax=Collybia nuda TaxID=64659 RepID=A0A9P5Y7P7_9AGAR|nr:hypothetical protein BDZ94DRAFT_636131 [Collybia nuda]
MSPSQSCFWVLPGSCFPAWSPIHCLRLLVLYKLRSNPPCLRLRGPHINTGLIFCPCLVVPNPTLAEEQAARTLAFRHVQMPGSAPFSFIGICL